MSVLAQLERLDHRLAGMPETAYVFEARKFRLRIAVLALMTLVALLSTFETPAGWLVVALAVGTAGKTVLDRRGQRGASAGAASEAGRWYER
ncbi:MAG TPA: hypothetical protein VNA20_07530 [Frankiaceae bacterium]|nr:hypothetical protein [Frankiaceae bacterium]